MLGVTKVRMEGHLFLHHINVVVFTDSLEYPSWMLHELPLKLVVAKVSPLLLKCHKQQTITKKK